MQTQSDILKSSVDFLLRRKAQAFIKAREAVVKCSSPAAIADLKANAKSVRQDLEFLMLTTSQDFDADAVIENYIGLGKVWTANADQIAKTAEEQGVSFDQAREILECTLSQAQAYAQTTRSNLIGIYQGWLSDIDPENGQHGTDEIYAELDKVVQDAYAKAGVWLRRDEGILIEGSAQDWEINLPTWSSVLPRITEAVKDQRRKIESRINQRAEQLRDQYNAAMAEINASDW